MSVTGTSTIRDNSTFGAFNGTNATSSFFAENNYWGGWNAAHLGGNSGPYHAAFNPSGKGNPVSSYVDCLPHVVAYLFNPADGSTSPPAVNLETNEMRWGGSTTYATEWDNAIDTWNASTSGAVNIYYAGSDENLIVEDIDDPLEDWAGKWFAEEEPPRIRLNEDQLSGATANQIQCVTTHELGHSLGLAHSLFGNVMYAFCDSGQRTLGTNDVSDYEFLWSDGYKWD
jgi:hypothetical protein